MKKYPRVAQLVERGANNPPVQTEGKQDRKPQRGSKPDEGSRLEVTTAKHGLHSGEISNQGNMQEVAGSSPEPRTNFLKRVKPPGWRWFEFRWGQYLGRTECPYMRRWVLGLKLFSIRLHHWYASDDDRNFHDHPWWFTTFVLWGGYTDESLSGMDVIKAPAVRFREALHRHTVRVERGGCWTLLITGPEVRKWGFWVKGKFRKAYKYFYEYGHHQCE